MEADIMDQISKIMRVAVDRKNEQEELNESQSGLLHLKVVKKEVR